MMFENHLPRPESVICCMSVTRPGMFRNCGTGANSLVSLLIITAVPTPQFGWQPQLTCPQSASGSVDQIGEIGERAHQRKREPVARRLSDADLALHVVGQVRQRVTLAQAAFRSDVFVAAGERHRLERDERDLLGIVHREPDDRADLIVIDAVDQRYDQNDFDAGFVQVVDRPQLHVEQVADLAVAVGVVADTVELQIRITKSGFGSLLRRIPCSWRTRFRWSRPARW